MRGNEAHFACCGDAKVMAPEELHLHSSWRHDEVDEEQMIEIKRIKGARILKRTSRFLIKRYEQPISWGHSPMAEKCLDEDCNRGADQVDLVNWYSSFSVVWSDQKVGSLIVQEDEERLEKKRTLAKKRFIE